MKKGLMLIVALVVLGSFVFVPKAEAALIEISSLIFTPVISPGSSSDPLSTQYVNLAPSGSLTVGTPAYESDSQPVGWYGVGLSLAPLGTPDGYTIWFDRNFATYDSAGYDVFQAVITQGNYIWAGGTVVGGYSWGGANYPGIEYNLGGWGQQALVMVAPGTDYYLNVGLLAGNDNLYPSWGSFSDVHIGVIPEPATMSLLGFGVLGLFGLRRKKA